MNMNTAFRDRVRRAGVIILLATGLTCVSAVSDAAAPPPATRPVANATAPPANASVPASVMAGTAEETRLLMLGPGDSVAVHVYGQPDMDGTLYVADDGTLSLPLVGAVPVKGLSPSEAGQRVEKALRDGRFLVDPHVTLTVAQSRSQRVSVLGEVKQPGRYPIESTTTVLDLLAQAGGATENSGEQVYVLRADNTGTVQRYSVNLKGLADARNAPPTQTLKGGDSVYVPKAEQFYVYGQVQQPGMYKVEPGMTILQAIARAGGITLRGSDRRVEIKRRGKKGDYETHGARPTDIVQADDVIRVKESIF
jgi:polysaccharide export outer membrane protein